MTQIHPTAMDELKNGGLRMPVLARLHRALLRDLGRFSAELSKPRRKGGNARR